MLRCGGECALALIIAAARFGVPVVIKMEAPRRPPLFGLFVPAVRLLRSLEAFVGFMKSQLLNVYVKMCMVILAGMRMIQCIEDRVHKFLIVILYCMNIFLILLIIWNECRVITV